MAHSVLVVDDSGTIRKIVEIALGRAGIQVRGADTAVKALAALAMGPTDLVLLDITLPSMNGYQICRAIKKHPQYKQIPIIFLTGKDGLLDKVKGKLWAGADDYMTKPFTPEALLNKVKPYLGASLLVPAEPAPVAKAAEPAD